MVNALLDVKPTMIVPTTLDAVKINVLPDVLPMPIASLEPSALTEDVALVALVTLTVDHTLAEMELVRDLAPLMMTVQLVLDAKMAFAFWDVIPKLIALMALFATADSASLDVLIITIVFPELSAVITFAKLAAVKTLNASLELFA